MLYVKNKGADQTVHQHSLISTFVFHCPGHVKATFALSNFSRPSLMSFAELAGLSQTQEGRLTSDQIKMSKKLKIIDMPRSAYRICLNRPRVSKIHSTLHDHEIQIIWNCVLCYNYYRNFHIS